MAQCTYRLEALDKSNHRSVIRLVHIITFVKIITWITSTIYKYKEPMTVMPTGVVIIFILSLHAIKAIEHDYHKAFKIFCCYWSFYLFALCIYYQTFMFEQIVMFLALFLLVFEVFMQKYELSNTLVEIFYDFHKDPILIYETHKSAHANMMFMENFGKLVKVERHKHHSQFLTGIQKLENISFEFHKEKGSACTNLLEILQKKQEFDGKELILRQGGDSHDKIFNFTFYKLENIYCTKTVCIFKDVTHIHQLQKANSQVQFRAVIMGCLTHELRTPVSWVMSILKSLVDYVQHSDEAMKLLSICNATIEVLRSLTEDFIDFTRFENEKGLPIKKESVNILEFFEGIEQIFAFQAEEKELIFNIVISPEVPQTIRTDPKRLKQVLMNLLSNSFKFTQRGKIEIYLNIRNLNRSYYAQNMLKESELEYTKDMSLLKHSNLAPDCTTKYSLPLWEMPNEKFKSIKNVDKQKFLTIEVIDTGIGMTKKQQKGLFTKFGTVGSNGGLNTNGLGLGLYLSKAICNKLGGNILVESMKGIGSTFTIEIPWDHKKEIK